jgi:hypothetical protein
MLRSLPYRVRLIAIVGMLVTTRAVAESSIRCDGGIVQIGDTKLDLIAKCGKPALQEQSSDGRTVVDTLDGQPLETPGVRAERWTYNFGPAHFLQVVSLEIGRVVAIERGGYGYSPEALRDHGTSRPRCESAAIHVGDKKLDLLAKCGGPASREVRRERRPASPLAGTSVASEQGHVNVDVELWTYDFGPQQFRLIVTLENGGVVRLERGNYGTGR